MATTNELLAEEAAMCIHLLAGTYLDQGLSMEQTLAVLHKAIDLVPQHEDDHADDCRRRAQDPSMQCLRV